MGPLTELYPNRALGVASFEGTPEHGTQHVTELTNTPWRCRTGRTSGTCRCVSFFRYGRPCVPAIHVLP